MDSISNKWRRYTKSDHFKYGLPMLLLTFGAVVVLQLYSKIRIENRDSKKSIIKSKELSKLIREQEQKTLEEEYEEFRENFDIDGWKNIRGPRPWEGDNTEYKELIERRAKESEKGWVFSKK